MRGRRNASFAVVVAALTLVVTGCTSGGDDVSGLKGDGTSFVAGSGVQTMVPVAKRGEPVDLSADTLDGNRLDLATLRGKPVVVNVWGSWCAPCRKEASALQQASVALKGQAAFVGINTRDNTGQAQAYERHYQVTYPSLYDKGTLLLALRGAVAPQNIPSTVVLDKEGRIAARFSGPVTKLTLVGMVQDVTKSDAS